MKSWSRVIARDGRTRRRMSRTDMCGLKYPKPFVFQRCAARWLTIRPPRKRYAKDIVTENWSKIYDDGSTRSRPSLIAVTRRGRPLANSDGWTKERERGKGRMENERKGENGRIQVSVARRGWNSWLDRSRLRDGDKLFISRRLATGQHFPYLSTILRLFIRARAHVVVGALCRASLSPFSLHPFVPLYRCNGPSWIHGPPRARRFTSVHGLDKARNEWTQN